MLHGKNGETNPRSRIITRKAKDPDEENRRQEEARQKERISKIEAERRQEDRGKEISEAERAQDARCAQQCREKAPLREEGSSEDQA